MAVGFCLFWFDFETISLLICDPQIMPPGLSCSSLLPLSPPEARITPISRPSAAHDLRQLNCLVAHPILLRYMLSHIIARHSLVLGFRACGLAYLVYPMVLLTPNSSVATPNSTSGTVTVRFSVGPGAASSVFAALSEML